MLISLSVSRDLFLRYVATVRNVLRYIPNSSASPIFVLACFSITDWRFAMAYFLSPVDPG